MIESAKQTCQAISDVLLAKKAQDIKIIDISEMTVIADAFVVASGRTGIQVKALCDDVEEAMDKKQVFCRRKEGADAGRWIIMDYGDVIVHIFSAQDRQFYNIERLWENGNNIIDVIDEV